MNDTRAKPYLAVLSYHGEHGRSFLTAVCSKCGSVLTVYVWSFHGCGKRCPTCKTIYGSGDLVTELKTVKHEGKWVFKVENWLFDHNNRRIEPTCVQGEN